MSQISEKLRSEFAAQDAIRDAGLRTPKNILRRDDIAYGEHPLQKLDVYRPQGTAGKLPVIVNVHGGGWVYGDKELYQYYAMDLAGRGFAVVNFSYRLAPEAKFPAQIEDIAAVFAWARANADEFDLDPGQLFAVGDSAGANLLGLYCAACTNPEYANALGTGIEFGPLPKGISFACGAYTVGGDIPSSDTDLALMEDLLGSTEPEKLALVDVRRNITPSFPETFFFTCTGDFLIDQAEALQHTLIRNSVPHVMRFYGDRDHILGHVFHCNMRSEAARLCNDEQCAFFRNIIDKTVR